MRRHKHRNARRIGVPKGILRHIVLNILKQGPRSGSELMEEIEFYTDWRPSPGSIYPLLSNLQEKEFIDPHPDEDPNLKRFILTNEGKKQLEDFKLHDEHLRSRYRTFRKIYWRLHVEMPEEIYESFATLLDAIDETHLHASRTQEDSRVYRDVLEHAANSLLGIGG